eukprot:763116-Hanusia_phi.AAC.4
MPRRARPRAEASPGQGARALLSCGEEGEVERAYDQSVSQPASQPASQSVSQSVAGRKEGLEGSLPAAFLFSDRR